MRMGMIVMKETLKFKWQKIQYFQKFLQFSSRVEKILK